MKRLTFPAAIVLIVALGAVAHALPLLELKIGNGLAGGLTELPGGVYDITGSGSDIWGTSDSFYFVYQEFDASQDLALECRVVSFTGGTNSWRKAGPMIRDSLNGNAINAMSVQSYSNGLRGQWRPSDGANSQSSGPGGNNAPTYLKVTWTAATNTISYFYKENLGDAWVNIASDVVLPMSGTLYMGLAVTAHDQNQQTTARFDNVAGFVFAPAATGTLQWDPLAGSGNWGTANWLAVAPGPPPPPPNWPVSADPDHIIARIDSPNQVTVEADHSAHTVELSGGASLLIGAGNTLTLDDKIDAPGHQVEFGSGASLIALDGGGTIGTALTNGDATIDIRREMTISAWDDQNIAGTLTKRGLGTLTLDNTGGGNNTDDLSFVIEGGTLEALGANPLGSPVGGTQVTLDGGTLAVGGSPVTLDRIHITVASDSGLDVDAAGTAAFGDLVLNGGVLRTTGTGSLITFNTTTITGSGFDTLVDVNPGPIDGGGLGATIVKRGPADLILDQPGANLLGSTFDVQEGRMLTEGLAPLGGGGGSGGSIVLSGGEWGLTSPGGANINVTNALTVTADSALTAGLFPELPGGGAGPTLITLSNLSLNSGILTLTGNDNYDFGVPGSLMGSGVAVAAGDLTVPGPIDVSDLQLVGGTLTRTGAGTPNGDVRVTQTLYLDSDSLDMTGSALDISTAAVRIGAGRSLTDDQDTLTVGSLDYRGTLNLVTPYTLTVASRLDVYNDLDLAATGSTLLTDNTTEVYVHSGQTLTVGHDLTVDELNIYEGTLILPPGGTVTADDEFDFRKTTIDFNLAGTANVRIRTSSVGDDFTTLNGTDGRTGGTTYIDRGALIVAPNAANLSDRKIQLDADNTDQEAVLMTNGLFTRPVGNSTGEVQFENNGGGFAALGGKLTVDFGGDGTGTGPEINWGAGASSGFNSKWLHFGHAIADSPVEVMNDINLGGNTERNVCVFNNAATDQDVAIWSGQITGGNTSAWFDKNGAGTLVMENPANDYVHRTRIYGGALRVGQDGVGLGNTDRIRFNGPDNSQAVIEAYGTFAWPINNGTGGVYWEEDGGFAAYGGALTVTLEGGAELDWNDGDDGFRGRHLHLGSETANDVVTLTNDIDGQGGDRYINVFDNPFCDDDYAVLSGHIHNIGHLNIRGTGTLEVTGLLETRTSSNRNVDLDGGGTPGLTLRVGSTGHVHSRDSILVDNGSALIAAYTGPPTPGDPSTFSVEVDNDLRVRQGTGSTLGGLGSFWVNDELDIDNGAIISPGMPYKDDDVAVVGGFVVPPADAAGTLTAQVGDRLRMFTGSTYKWDLALTDQDLVEVLGDLQLDADWILQVCGIGGSATAADEFILFSYTGSATVAMDGSNVDVVLDFSQVDPDFYTYWDVSGVQVLHSLLPGGGGIIYLTGLEALAIPEPATLTLLAAGFAALAIRRRRRA